MTTIYQWEKKQNTEKYFFKKDKYKNISLEVGSGNGLFLSTIASSNPNTTYIGIERRIKSIHKSQKKIERLRLKNVILIHGDFFTALNRFFEKNLFDVIYVNFPDPWHKKRHKKKRAIQASTLQMYHSFLRQKGELYFVTDVFNYIKEGVQDIVNSNLFFPLMDKPYYSTHFENYPQSLYEIKAREQGREIYYSHFVKNSSSYL